MQMNGLRRDDEVQRADKSSVEESSKEGGVALAPFELDGVMHYSDGREVPLSSFVPVQDEVDSGGSLDVTSSQPSDGVVDNDVNQHEVMQGKLDSVEARHSDVVLAPFEFEYELGGERYLDYKGKTTPLTMPEEVQQAKLLYFCAAQVASFDKWREERIAEKLEVPYGLVTTWSQEDKCSAQTIVAELEKTPVTVAAMNRLEGALPSLDELDRWRAIELNAAGYVGDFRKTALVEQQPSPVKLNGLEDTLNRGERVLRRDIEVRGITVDDGQEKIFWREEGDYLWNELNDSAYASPAQIIEYQEEDKNSGLLGGAVERAGHRHRRNFFVNRLRGAFLRLNSLEDALDRGERVFRRDIQVRSITVDDGQEKMFWQEDGDFSPNELSDMAYASPAQINEYQEEDKKEIAELAQSIAQASQKMANISVPSKESDLIKAKISSFVEEKLRDAPGDLAGWALEALAGPAGPVLSAIVSGVWARYTEYEVGFMMALASYDVDITDAKQIEDAMMNRTIRDDIHQRAQRFADDKAFLSLLGSAASSAVGTIEWPIGNGGFYGEGNGGVTEWLVRLVAGESAEFLVEEIGKLYLDTDLRLNAKPSAQELEMFQNRVRSLGTEDAITAANKLTPILNLARQEEQADREGKLIGEFNTFFLSSELKGKDPQAYAQFVRETGARYGVDKFYINAQALVDEMPQIKDELLKLSPVFEAQLRGAYEKGGPVALPIEEYAVIVTPELAEPLLRYMTVSSKSWSLAEFEAKKKEFSAEQRLLRENSSKPSVNLGGLETWGTSRVMNPTPNSYQNMGVNDFMKGWGQLK